jgi:hypothetical protein
MVELEQIIQEVVKNISARIQIKTVSWGVVTEVTETTCTVERDNAPTLHNVLLNAIDDDLQSYVTVYPKLGSNVLVGIVENLTTEAVVLKCSEVEKVTVKIGNQTLFLNQDGWKFNSSSDNLYTVMSDFISQFQKLADEVNKIKVAIGTSPDTAAIVKIRNEAGKINKRMNTILK